MTDITRMHKQCVPGLPFGGEGGGGGSWERGYLAKWFHSSSECKASCFQLYLVNTVRTWLLVMEGQHLNSSVHVHVELPHKVR